MRRVLVYAMSARGHINRVLAVVETLARLDAHVTVVTDPVFEPAVLAAGAHFVDLYPEGGDIRSVDDRSFPRSARIVSWTGRHVERLVAQAGALRPDIVAYEGFAVIGRVVARHLRKPHVHLTSGHDTQRPGLVDQLLRDIPVALDDAARHGAQTLARWGLENASPFSYLAPPSPDLNIVSEPRQWLDDESRARFEPVAFFGSLRSPGERAGVTSPSERGALHRVYISFGTVIWSWWKAEALAALRALAEAVALRGDTEGLVSLGGTVIDDDARAEIERPRVRVVAMTDQPAVLNGSTVFVTHQGLNSTHEAVYARCPMISCPFFWDQPLLAARAAAFGVAVPLVPGARVRAGVTVEDASRALGQVLDHRRSFDSALEAARAWEEEAIGGRGGIAKRILEL